MKKLINIRNSVIIILCITIICMAFGFIVISMELKTEKDRVPSFQVVFSKIEKISSVKGSTIEPVGNADIDENGSKLYLQFELNAVHDELIYLATIRNNGTIPAKIVDIMKSPDYEKETFSKMIQPVTIQLSDYQNKIIQPNEEMDLKIIVYYNASTGAGGKRGFQYDLGILAESAIQ